ncbi:MAG TPA: hypothetical protein VGC41_19840, partial [Kofleriaceae bacterium]
EEQIRYVPNRRNIKLGSSANTTRYVKPDPAGALEYEATKIVQAVANGTRRTTYESWCLALTTEPRFRLQIADKKLVKSGNKENWRHQKQSFAQRYPDPVALDDAALENRFDVWGTDAVAIRKVLARPDVRDRLLQFAEVDLTVDDRSIVFSDPAGKNRKAERTGGARILDTIPVHQNIQAMLGAIREEITYR